MDANYLRRFPVYIMVQSPIKIDKQTGQPIMDNEMRFVMAGCADEKAIVAFGESDDCAAYMVANKLQDKVDVMPVMPEHLSRIVQIVKESMGAEVGVLVDSRPGFQGFLISHGQALSGGSDDEPNQK